MTRTRDGKIKIDIGRTFPEFLLDLSFLARFTVLFAFADTENGVNYAYYITFFCVVGMTALVYILGRRTVIVKLPTLWYGTFLLFSLLSVLWAQYSEDLTLRYISKMLQVLIICFCITLYIRRKKDLERFLSIFIAACAITVVSVLVRVSPAEWFEGFLGRGVTGNNINIVAYTCVAGLCLAFYKAYYLKLRSYYLPAVLMAVYIVLSSSRKALLMAAVMLLGMALFFVKKKNYIFKLFAVLIILCVAAVAIFEVPVLYEAIGFRFEKMFNYFFAGDIAVDGSIALRQSFATVAAQEFAEHPFFGVGLANVSYLLFLYFGRQTYVHNNYLEIASGLGITGLILYYWYYIYLIIRLARKAYRGDSLCAALFFLMIVMVVGEITMVTFYNDAVQVMLTVCFCAVNMKRDSAHGDYYGNYRRCSA